VQDGPIRLSCPRCGAGLEITTDIDRFICLHCGTQQLVKRGGGIISLHPLVEGIARVQQGTDRTAAELVIRRLIEEIAVAKAEEAAAIEVASQNDLRPEQVKLRASNLEGVLLWSGYAAIILSIGVFLRLLDGPTTAWCFPPLLIGICIPARIGRERRTRVAQAEALLAHDAAKAERWICVNEQTQRVRDLEDALERNRRIVNS
jgi:hypothetical protein